MTRPELVSWNHDASRATPDKVNVMHLHPKPLIYKASLFDSDSNANQLQPLNTFQPLLKYLVLSSGQFMVGKIEEKLKIFSGTYLALNRSRARCADSRFFCFLRSRISSISVGDRFSTILTLLIFENSRLSLQFRGYIKYK